MLRCDAHPSGLVWRSVRAGGDTKTKKSRRTLKPPQRCVDVLRDHQALQDEIRQAAGVCSRPLPIVAIVVYLVTRSLASCAVLPPDRATRFGVISDDKADLRSPAVCFARTRERVPGEGCWSA